MKNKEIKEKFNNLKNKQVRYDSLERIENNLKDYMDFYPVKDQIHDKYSNRISIFSRPLIFKTATVFLVIAILIGGESVVYASQFSLPGETLYPIKTLAENVKKAFIFNEEEKIEFEIKLAQERVKEINSILREEKQDTKNIKIAEKLLEKHIQKAKKLSNEKTQEFKAKVDDNISNINKEKNNNKSNQIKEDKDNFKNKVEKEDKSGELNNKKEGKK